MKIFAITDNYRVTERTDSDRIGWIFLPDSAIFRQPNPYFLQEETDSAAAFPSLAIRIDRIGKSVSPRFASRYTLHAALAVNLRNLTLENELKYDGLPGVPAWGYDKSLLLSDWVETSLEEMAKSEITVGLEEGTKMVWHAEELTKGLAEIIAEVSRMNILKMGDIILPGFHHTGLTLSPGSQLSASMRIPGSEEVSVHIPIK